MVFILCLLRALSAQAVEVEAPSGSEPSTAGPAVSAGPAFALSLNQATPLQTFPVQKQTIPRRSRVGLSFDIGGGLLWNYGQLKEDIIKDDGSTIKQSTQIRVSQPHLKANAILSMFAMDACQLSSENSPSSCADFIVNARFGVGNQFARDMRDIQTAVGIEGDFFFGEQRRIALTMKADVGYSYTFAKELNEQANILEPYQVRPDSTHAFLIAASPGILVNLGNTTPAAPIALYADIQVAFYGGQFSFLVPIGIRFRF